MINQRQIKNFEVDTISNMKLLSGRIDEICYCAETSTFYRFIIAAIATDDLTVVSTSSGGLTRWIGVAGRYTYLLNEKTYSALNSLSNEVEGLTTYVSDGGIILLDDMSSFTTLITGTLTQIIVLPDCTTLISGRMFRIINNSTAPILINTNSFIDITIINSGEEKTFTCLYQVEDLSSWNVKSNTGGGGTVTTADSLFITVNQTSHGFNNDFIYNDGSTWIKAIATSEATKATHFAISVTVDSFKAYSIGDITVSGMTDHSSAALVAGETYFLSNTTAGKCVKKGSISMISANNIFIQQLFKARNSNGILLNIDNKILKKIQKAISVTSYSMLPSDDEIVSSKSSGTCTITIPLFSTLTKPITIHNNGAATVSLVTTGGELINGNISSYNMSRYETITLTPFNGSLLISSKISNSVTLEVVHVSGAYILTGIENVVLCDTAGSTVTLPTAVGIKGKEFNIKATVSSGGTSTINTTSSQTIDGSTTLSIYAGESARIVSDGLNWYLI